MSQLGTILGNGVEKSKVSEIKKNMDSILNFQSKMTDIGMSKRTKVTKLGEDVQRRGEYIWFKQKRMEGTYRIRILHLFELFIHPNKFGSGLAKTGLNK